MPKGILGKKIGMSQYFTETGDVVCVTIIEAGPCLALQVKTLEKDGYQAVQLGFGKKRSKSANKPELGHFKKANTEPLQFIKEVELENGEDIKQGQQFLVDVFKQGEYVDVSGISIGKGFQGGVKRWHWRGGPASHGSMSHRMIGSIQSGPRLTKVTPGHHMAGHMGHVKVTVQNLEIVEIDKDKNILAVKGAVPGPDGNYLVIRKSIKGKKKSIHKVAPAAGEKKEAKKAPKKETKPKKEAKK